MNRLALLLAGMVALVPAIEAGEPTAESLKKCPNGHATLKDVKIVYGFAAPAGEGKEGVDYVRGGCIVLPDSPGYQVICTECRFVHTHFKASPKYGSWHLHSKDLKSFPIPFTQTLQTFPVPSASKLVEPVAYSQVIGDDLSLTSESLQYNSTGRFEEMRESISRWFKDQNISCQIKETPPESSPNGATRRAWQWTSDIPRASVTLTNWSNESYSTLYGSFNPKRKTVTP